MDKCFKYFKAKPGHKHQFQMGDLQKWCRVEVYPYVKQYIYFTKQTGRIFFHEPSTWNLTICTYHDAQCCTHFDVEKYPMD